MSQQGTNDDEDLCMYLSAENQYSSQKTHASQTLTKLIWINFRTVQNILTVPVRLNTIIPVACFHLEYIYIYIVCEFCNLIGQHLDSILRRIQVGFYIMENKYHLHNNNT